MKNTICVCLCTTALLLAGCGIARPAQSETPAAEPQVTASAPTPTVYNTPTPTPLPVTPLPMTPAPTAEPVRQDGERFETVIMLEGMEETVKYEHLRNEALGIEMDYEYESFVRQSTPERERFISTWDNPENPENYLEIIYSPENAETIIAFVSSRFSNEYDITKVTRNLTHAGECTRIEASVIKGSNRMADHIQVVYIIPAADGCRVASAYYVTAASEGFAHRLSYMLDTLSVIDKNGKSRLTDEQALSAVRSYCLARNPELQGIIDAGQYPVYWDIASGDAQEVVVLYRSYTGSQTRYYIDRTTGDCYVTEAVPGVTAGEERTDERLNVWDYTG